MSQMRATAVLITQPKTPWYQTKSVLILRWLLVAIAAVTTAAGGAATIFAKWVTDDLGEPRAFVQTLEPLAANPQFQTAVVNQVGGSVQNYVLENPVTSVVEDWTSSFDQFLGENSLASALAGLLGIDGQIDTSGLAQQATETLAEEAKEIAQGETQKFLASPEFPSVYKTILTSVHSQVMQAVVDPGVAKGDPVTVSLDVNPIIEAVVPNISGIGGILQNFTPTIDQDVPLFEIDDVTALRTANEYLNGKAGLYLAIALSALGVVLLLAPRRWFALVATAVLTIGASVYFLLQIPNYPQQAIIALDPDLAPVVRQAWKLLSNPPIEQFQWLLGGAVAVLLIGGIGAVVQAVLARR